MQISRWWQATSDTVRATFTTLLNELDSELPILILATHDKPLDHLAEELSDLFHEEDGEIYHIRCFTEQERRKFFSSLLMQKCLKPPSVRRVIKRELEVLPLAPAPPPRQLSVAEKVKIERKEEATLRELRIFLREILAKLARNKLFYMFTRPVDIEEVPDYLEIIQQPMDLETMMTKIDRYAYESAKDFLTDIELICSNALEYNPNRDAKGASFFFLFLFCFSSCVFFLFPISVGMNYCRQDDSTSSLHIARYSLRFDQSRNGYRFRRALSGNFEDSQSKGRNIISS